MERNLLRQSENASAIPDVKYEMFPSEMRFKTANITTSAAGRFPFYFVKSEETISFAKPSLPYEQNIDDFGFQDNVERRHELNCLLNTFPTKDLNAKYSFPIRCLKNNMQIFQPEVQISVEIDSSNKITCQNRFPSIQTKNTTRFPLIATLIQAKSAEHTCRIRGRQNLLTPSANSVFTKMKSTQPSDCKVIPLQFPITQSILNEPRSIVSIGEKIVFPTKTEILSNACVTTMNRKINNTLSLTMTQSGSFVDENFKEETLMAPYNTEKQANSKYSGYEHKEQKQEQLTYVHNYNDDVLATDAAKNIPYSGQPKCCDELQHIAEHIQNSRSASGKQCSLKNIDDLENHYRQEKNKDKQVCSTNIKAKIIKKPSPSPPLKATTAITALAKQSVRSTVQKEEQNYDVATNAEISRSINLSDINFEHGQQPRSTYLTHSEVRDPSSRVDLIVDGRVACEPNTASIRIEPIPSPAEQSANETSSAVTSSNYQLTSLTWPIHKRATSHIAEKPHVQNECQSLVTERVLTNVKSDVFAIRCVSPIDGVAVTDFVRGVEIAMTLTKAEEQKEEDNISVSSLYLDDNTNSFVEEVPSNEMKFEMDGPKSASNVTTRPLASSTPIRNEQRQLSASGRSVLSAATDISKLANFGKIRRESGLLSHSESSASFDAKNSVLPTRTLLRRQRRMQSQGSEDKQEDPIERLNRLRARISGALSEVKGVLKHYSTDESAEAEQTPTEANSISTISRPNFTLDLTKAQQSITTQPTLKEEGPVSFRFVRKVRRRSVFSEEVTSEVKKEANFESAEVSPVMNGGESSSCGFPREGTTEDKEKIEVHDKLSLGLRNENDKISNGAVCSTLKNSAAVVTTSAQNIPEEFEVNIEFDNFELNEQIRQSDNKATHNPLNQAKFDPQSTDIAGGEAGNRSSITEAANLETVKEKSLDESSTPIVPHALSISSNEAKTKKRIIKSKGNIRRASIAAVESSEIRPPVNAAISIKAQRRPSDSEAILKRKVKTSEAVNNDPIKNLKISVKEKRPSMKKITTISKAEINQPNNSTEDALATAHIESNAIATLGIVTVKSTITEPVPTAPHSLPTQLTPTIAIDDALFNGAEKLNNTKTKTKATQPLSIATNTNTSRPTKLIDENGAMVAALASQLCTGEASSNTLNTDKRPSTILTANVKVVTHIIERAKEHKSEDQSKTLTVTDIKIAECKKLNDLKVQPTSQSNCADPVQATSIAQCSKDSQISKPFDSIEKPNIYTVETLKADTVSTGQSSLEQHTFENISQQLLEQLEAEGKGAKKMPELQVTPAPVKPVQVFAENDPGKIEFPTKKTTVKTIVHKNSFDQANEKNKSNKSLTAESEKVEDQIRLINDKDLTSNLVVEKSEITEEENVLGDEIEPAEEPPLESPNTLTPLKKPRKVKKKVIIKRQHRKLSVGETTFFKKPEQPDATPFLTDTLERAIAYVTDDEDEGTEQSLEPAKPIKSCMKQREFQVGEWVMYGDRFRKTQIRWKKGQITERITSISYKIQIDGKEVSAHISYIKKYTGRRVNFGGKEYLEIDYEQIAEEERRARTYSIWNMV